MKYAKVVYSARKALINLGKLFPFLLCVVVGLQYVEMLFSSILSHFCIYGGVVMPYMPLSSIVARFYEYDFISVVFTLILAYAIETCKWNKMAIAYLLFNLLEKQYLTMPLYIDEICIICVANLMAIFYLLWKGINIVLKIAK